MKKEVQVDESELLKSRVSSWEKFASGDPNMFPGGGLDSVDPSIWEVVTSLNQLYGIRTIGSCGGHKDGEWSRNWRLPPGWFYVEFLVKPGSEVAHMSLMAIASLCRKISAERDSWPHPTPPLVLWVKGKLLVSYVLLGSPSINRADLGDQILKATYFDMEAGERSVQRGN